MVSVVGYTCSVMWVRL